MECLKVRVESMVFLPKYTYFDQNLVGFAKKKYVELNILTHNFALFFKTWSYYLLNAEKIMKIDMLMKEKNHLASFESIKWCDDERLAWECFPFGLRLIKCVSLTLNVRFIIDWINFIPATLFSFSFILLVLGRVGVLYFSAHIHLSSFTILYEWNCIIWEAI